MGHTEYDPVPFLLKITLHLYDSLDVLFWCKCAGLRAQSQHTMSRPDTLPPNYKVSSRQSNTVVESLELPFVRWAHQRFSETTSPNWLLWLWFSFSTHNNTRNLCLGHFCHLLNRLQTASLLSAHPSMCASYQPANRNTTEWRLQRKSSANLPSVHKWSHHCRPLTPWTQLGGNFRLALQSKEKWFLSIVATQNNIS